MIYRASDGRYHVRLVAPAPGQVLEWASYRTQADAAAVERRLVRVLAQEAGLEAGPADDRQLGLFTALAAEGA
jgi:hypothetical protein